MKVKTAGLIGPALDWAVGTALELPVEICQIFQYGRPNGKHYISIGETDKDGAEVDFEPSEEWSQGGPLIEREWLNITSWPNESDEEQRWQCHQYDVPKPYQALGPTPLIAGMRCFVASRLGDEVDVPDELADCLI